MAVYYKPQSPIQSGEDFIYPITTADQVKVDKDTRLNAVGVYLKNIDNSTDTTVYGNNATTLGGVAAEDYALKTDTAPDSSKLGGKAPEYYIQPRNLLDNSDFRNPVNQRGITSETSVPAYSYFLDRWVNQTNEARSFTLSTSGIGLLLVTTLLQKIEKIEAGKIVTFAIKLSDGTIATLTGTVQYTNDGSWTRFASINHSFGDMYMETMNGFVNVVVWNTKSITIEWAALYEGSYTAETLPPYVPKGYAAELAECQRYFMTMAYPVIPCGNNPSGTQVYGFLPFRMRVDNPTVTCDTLYFFKGDSTFVSVSSASAASYGAGTRIVFNISSSVSGNLAGAIAGNRITISADL